MNGAANKYLRKIAKHAGLVDASDEPRKVGFHLSRHFLAGYLLKNGTDVHTIQRILGHSSVRVTEQYLCGFERPTLCAPSVCDPISSLLDNLRSPVPRMSTSSEEIDAAVRPILTRIRTQSESIADAQGLIAELGRDPDHSQLLDFSACDGLGPTAAALIAAWRDYVGNIAIDSALAPDSLSAYGLVKGAATVARDPLLAVEPAPRNISEAYERILDFWLGVIGKEGRRAASASGELAVNAAWHGGRESCATLAAGVGEIEGGAVVVFATVSLSDSIPNRVRAYLKNPSLSDEQAVRWAAMKGKSTWLRADEKSRRSPSGLGLTEAQRQACLLKGRVEILTGDIVLQLGDDVEVSKSPVPFRGTLARLVIPLP